MLAVQRRIGISSALKIQDEDTATLSTKPCAIKANMGAGVVSPCTSNIFLPSSGPHSYTLITPKKMSTSRAPGKILGGQGQLVSSVDEMNGIKVSRGEGTTLLKVVMFLEAHRRVPISGPATIESTAGHEINEERVWEVAMALLLWLGDLETERNVWVANVRILVKG